MIAEPKSRTVRTLLNLYGKGMLRANPEYQRGSVWSATQAKKLVDSVLRGYPIPLIYLHHIRIEEDGLTNNVLEIIDGQQRTLSFYLFSLGVLKLLDPVADDREARFPEFIKRQPCPWAGCTIETLPDGLKEQFLNTELAVVDITTDNPNEARDLFIRLQGGLPLTAQEKRDAWPGDFTEYILRLGGKPEIPGYEGHPFFRLVSRRKSGDDRGKVRTLAAQMAMLFFHHRQHGPESFLDIKAGAIDDFYYAHLDFDRTGPDARRFEAILDRLHAALSGGKRPPIRAHEAIHLALLVDTLLDDYTPDWQDRLADAGDAFNAALAGTSVAREDGTFSEYWTRYGQWARTNSDQADKIRIRHEFFVERMLGFLAPLTRKDAKRAFSPAEREIVYYRDRKRCAVCNGVVSWADAEIHHVHEHARGGETSLENAALVHRACHPKGADAVAFASTYTPGTNAA